MDQQQTQRVEQAGEQLTDAVRQSFQTIADRTVDWQESNLRLTQNFFQNWMEQLQAQTQRTREAAQTVQEQGQRQQEALETLSQEGTNVYSDFLNSALSFYQEAIRSASQVAQSNMQSAEQVTRQGVQAASQAAQETERGARRSSS